MFTSWGSVKRSFFEISTLLTTQVYNRADAFPKSYPKEPSLYFRPPFRQNEQPNGTGSHFTPTRPRGRSRSQISAQPSLRTRRNQ